MSMTLLPRTAAPDTVVLGELLLARRNAEGLTLATLEAITGFDAARIVSVETGRHDLSDVELDRLLRSYPITQQAGLFSELVVEVSLDGGWVAMRRKRRSPGRRPAADRNLLTYLSLVYEDRSLALGAQVSLKSVDLSLLRPALAIRRSEVQIHLERITAQIPAALTKNRSLLAVAAAAGIAVAAGAVILIPGSAPQNLTALPEGSTVAPLAEAVQSQSIDAAEDIEAGAEPEVLVDIGTALVIERELPPQSERYGTELTSTVDPRIDIGTALVIERPSGTPSNDSQFDSPKTTRGPPPASATLSNKKETN